MSNTSNQIARQSAFPHKGVNVITVDLIAEKHNQPYGEIVRLFVRNKDQFSEGADYFFVSREDILNGSEPFRSLKDLLQNNRQRGVYLFTESGYYKLVKPMNDPAAWEVYGKVLNQYFEYQKVKKARKKKSTYIPQWQKRTGIPEHEAQEIKENNQKFRRALIENHIRGPRALAQTQTALYKRMFGDNKLRKNVLQKWQKPLDASQIRKVSVVEHDSSVFLGHVSSALDSAEDTMEAVYNVVDFRNAFLSGDAQAMMEKSFEMASKMDESRRIEENSNAVKWLDDPSVLFDDEDKTA